MRQEAVYLRGFGSFSEHISSLKCLEACNVSVSLDVCVSCVNLWAQAVNTCVCVCKRECAQGHRPRPSVRNAGSPGRRGPPRPQQQPPHIFHLLFHLAGATHTPSPAMTDKLQKILKDLGLRAASSRSLLSCHREGWDSGQGPACSFTDHDCHPSPPSSDRQTGALPLYLPGASQLAGLVLRRHSENL